MDVIKQYWYGCRRYQHSLLPFTKQNKLLVGNCLNEELNIIKDACEQVNVPYVIIDGTLLGAVRENNFIPNDDDIDVSIIEWDRFKTEVIPILKQKARLKKLNDDWYQIISSNCENIPNAENTIHSDIINANYSRKTPTGFQHWKNTSHLFDKPLETYTIGDTEVTGANRDVSEAYLTEKYGNWKVRRCDAGYLKQVNFIVAGIIILFTVISFIFRKIPYITYPLLIVIVSLLIFLIVANRNAQP